MVSSVDFNFACASLTTSAEMISVIVLPVTFLTVVLKCCGDKCICSA